MVANRQRSEKEIEEERLRLLEEIKNIRQTAEMEIKWRMDKLHALDKEKEEGNNVKMTNLMEMQRKKLKSTARAMAPSAMPRLTGEDAKKALKQLKIEVSPSTVVYSNKDIQMKCENNGKLSARVTTVIGRKHMYVKCGEKDEFSVDRKTLKGAKNFDVEILINAKLVGGRYVGDSIAVVSLPVIDVHQAIRSEPVDSDTISDLEKGWMATKIYCSLPGFVITPHSDVKFSLDSPETCEDGSYLVKYHRKREGAVIGYAGIEGQPWVRFPI